MKRYIKKDYPLIDIRRRIETGPIVLVSSMWKGRTNIMTMGWHMMMEFSPALFGCYIWERNHSFEMIRRSRQCVINVPTVDLADQVVGIGNTSGATIDKFAKFGLTADAAEEVQAPLVRECYASFECRLHDSRLVPRYSLFVWEVVKAHVATSPRRPQTMHYRGDGEFMVAGRTLNLSRKFSADRH